MALLQLFQQYREIATCQRAKIEDNPTTTSQLQIVHVEVKSLYTPIRNAIISP
jgi:hypothetical protein